MSTSAEIRIAVVDAGRIPHVVDAVLGWVGDRFKIVRTDDRDADFVFHSCLGREVLKYPGVRIYVTGENVSPDFAISDYALAFDRIEFGDRYRWLPLLRLYPEACAHLRRPRPDPAPTAASKEGFCAYVMSNTRDSAPERTRLFELLSDYKPVNSGGRWRNNTGGPVADKIAFQSRHRFVLAVENTSYPGYLTEKFAQAAQSDAVPVYWGDPLVADTFNSRAFVNCHDYDSLEAAVEEVKRIDADEHAYRTMLAEPWYRDGVEPGELRDDGYRKFLTAILSQPREQAYRRNRGRWGRKYEEGLRRMAFQPELRRLELIRDRLRGRR